VFIFSLEVWFTFLGWLCGAAVGDNCKKLCEGETSASGCCEIMSKNNDTSMK